jgi:hypothetical protein
MGVFFEGWRRKSGCVTLLMALALTCLWVRSFRRQEVVHVCPGRSPFVASSTDENFGLARCVYETHAVAISKSITIGNSSLKWLNVGCSSDLLADLGNQGEYWTGAESEWHRGWVGLCFGVATHTTLYDEHVVWHWKAPCWSVVFPLTLLSAYLILSRPRASTARSWHPAHSSLNESAVTST